MSLTRSKSMKPMPAREAKDGVLRDLATENRTSPHKPIEVSGNITRLTNGSAPSLPLRSMTLSPSFLRQQGPGAGRGTAYDSEAAGPRPRRDHGALRPPRARFGARDSGARRTEHCGGHSGLRLEAGLRFMIFGTSATALSGRYRTSARGYVRIFLPSPS